ncbi:MAG: hypothetical protein HW416_878 [Chloroflexi bacterium]|nr:hypothetical protein [Chloroflexota bacterium]
MEDARIATPATSIKVGTSGYSYKEWLGVFYPDRMKPADMLPFYSDHFTTVEINNTFYRMPKKEVLEKWAGQVPADFTFVLKASQRITHMKRLRDTSEDVNYFLTTAAVLGDRLGPVFFQLAESTKKDVPRLVDFLAALPEHRPPVAFEFRNESWFDDEVYETLRSHNVSLCISDTDEGTTPFASTASWGYLRLRRSEYTPSDLRAWHERIISQAWQDTFLFFKHEDEAKGPRFAVRFMELLRASPE